ncbi:MULTISPECIES: serine hydrolase [unclassified Streptomyces]|uniref:serine hydrolase n=1 Tax=unclassified Streptomyces TaxID=2593676 RepID=UPI000364C30B|nr:MULTISPECIES: serine hydrolase [unclassified Streptomyces]
MLNRLRPVPRPRTGALLVSAAALLSAGALGAAAPAHAEDASRVTAAVLPLDGARQQPVVYGDDSPYDTASIVKVDILATALLQAQDAGRSLTARERAWAEPMIRESDNAAANALWRQIGRAPGLAAANKRLGLTETQGGPGAEWGLTRTTASDQIRLLRAVFDPPKTGPAALNETSRTYLRTLMNSVDDEQAWGVSAAGSASGTALKNGWLQRSATGLWDVNSVGRITVGGHRYLVAVLSAGNASMDDGVSLVQRTARTAVSSAAGR